MFSKFSAKTTGFSGGGGTPTSTNLSGGSSSGGSVSNLNVLCNSNSASSGASILEGSALAQQYEVGKLVASAGPSFVWKIYEGYRKSDAKVSFFYVSV